MDAPSRRPFLSTSLRFGGVVDVMVTLAVAGTWIGCLGRTHWLFDLFDHFRLQYFVLCAMAALWLGWRRRWRLFVVAVISLSVNGWPIARTTWVAAPDHPQLPQWKLKVVCFNVLTSNREKAAVLDYFRSTKADVIIALEMNQAWEHAMEKLEPDYPHQLVNAQEDNFGLGVYSRVPWREARLRTFAQEDVLSFTATLVHDSRELLLVATHPVPPLDGVESRNAMAQLEAIGRFVAQRKAPALVVGDFNAAPWSRAMKALKSHAALDFRTSGVVWQPTWMLGSPLMLPLDHALCTPPLLIERRDLGPDLGSDHRSQELHLRWQSPE